MFYIGAAKIIKMIEFKPEKNNPLGDAMHIKSQLEANQYRLAYTHFLMDLNPSMTFMEADARARNNIGYYAGYCDSETFHRVLELFDCQHPVFGKTLPGPEEAFRMGMEMSEKLKKIREDILNEQESMGEQ